MNKLKELRVKSGISQEHLAEISGLSRALLYYLETNKRPMRLQHAKVLAPIFDVSVDYIMNTDAIYYCGNFGEALSNLFDQSFDDFVEASTAGILDERSRLLFLLVDDLLHEQLSEDDLRVILGKVKELSRKDVKR